MVVFHGSSTVIGMGTYSGYRQYVRFFHQEDLRIVVPNQTEDLVVKLIARAWERGMYMVGCDEKPSISDPFMVRGVFTCNH